MNNNSITARLFHHVLEEQQISGREMARQLKVHHKTIENYLNGSKSPSEESLQALVQLSNANSLAELTDHAFPGAERPSPEASLPSSQLNEVPHFHELTDQELQAVYYHLHNAQLDLEESLAKKRWTARRKFTKTNLHRKVWNKLDQELKNAESVLGHLIRLGSPEPVIQLATEQVQQHQKRLDDCFKGFGTLSVPKAFFHQVKLQALQREYEEFKAAVAAVQAEMERRKVAQSAVEYPLDAAQEPKSEPAPQPKAEAVVKPLQPEAPTVTKQDEAPPPGPTLSSSPPRSVKARRLRVAEVVPLPATRKLPDRSSHPLNGNSPSRSSGSTRPALTGN